jgi:hypothetical protein
LKRNLGLIVSVGVLLVVFTAAGLLVLNPSARQFVFGDPRVEQVGSLRRITLGPGTIVEMDDEGSAFVFIGNAREFPRGMEGALYSVQIEGPHAIGYYTMRGASGRDPVAYAIIDGEAGTITRHTSGSPEAAQAWSKLTGLAWPAHLQTK